MGGISLKAARVNKNLTQTEAAKKLGITPKTLYSYENGLSFPDIPILEKILELYGVDYDDIIFLPNKYVFNVE